MCYLLNRGLEMCIKAVNYSKKRKEKEEPTDEDLSEEDK